MAPITSIAASAVSLLLALLCTACGEYSDSAPPLELVSNGELAPYEPGAFGDIAEGALKHYLIAADALAHDRFAEARVALGAMAKHADDPLEPLAATAAGASDIETLRRSFKPLSAKMLAIDLPQGYAVAFCPMAFDYEGGHWIQAEGEIMNPYYGSGMLHCGAFKKGE